MTAPSVRAEMATALREVNARFNELPPERQDSIDLAEGQPVDDALDRALTADDRASALAVIRDWRDFYLRLFREAS